MAILTLNLSIFNNTPSTWTLVSCTGISPPPSPIGPSTQVGPLQATSDFEINGSIVLADGNGTTCTIGFMMPVLGNNDFPPPSFNPSTPVVYGSEWDGSTKGTTVTVTAEIDPAGGAAKKQ